MKKLITILSFSVLLLSNMYAQGDGEWVRQHPIPQLVQMYDVEMDPSGLGLAVGNKGTIFRTTNFGASWDPVETGFLHTIFEVVFVPGTGGQQAWVGFSGSTRVGRTTDGGLSWQVIDTGNSLSSAVYLSAPDVNTAFVGTQNGILKTTDQGQSWTEITPAPGQNWSSISFVDANTGWAGTSSGAIYRTTDGGATWTEPSPGQFSTWLQLHFVDASNGYAAVFRSFYRTTDGGENWTLLSDAAFATNLDELDVADADFIVGTVGNTSFASTDGGLNWSRVLPLSYTYNNEGICALPDGQVWIVGSHTMIAHSTDFGMSYADQVAGNKNAITSIHFTDMQHGWATARNGTVLRTDNAGGLWQEVNIPDGGQVLDGIAFSPNEFWACNGNSIVRTTDGGQSWEAFEGAVSGVSTFTSITEVEGKVFATNYNGKVYRTTDGGANWEALPTQFEDLLFDVHFPDPETGYAVGQDSTVLKTTDGGDSWTRLDIPTSFNLAVVFFLDANRGWVTPSASVSEIFYTEDGGASWETQALPSGGFWQDIYFSSPTTGYIAGGSVNQGRVLRTTDGGQSWELFHSTYGMLGGVSEQNSANGSRVWIGGFGGNIELLDDVQVGTRQAVDIDRLDVFPNPSSGTSQIRLPQGLSPAATIAVYDAMGRRRLALPAAPQLSLEHLESGWYLIRLESRGKLYQARVLISR